MGSKIKNYDRKYSFNFYHSHAEVHPFRFFVLPKVIKVIPFGWQSIEYFGSHSMRNMRPMYAKVFDVFSANFFVLIFDEIVHETRKE